MKFLSAFIKFFSPAVRAALIPSFLGVLLAGMPAWAQSFYIIDASLGADVPPQYQNLQNMQTDTLGALIDGDSITFRNDDSSLTMAFALDADAQLTLINGTLNGLTIAGNDPVGSPTQFIGAAGNAAINWGSGLTFKNFQNPFGAGGAVSINGELTGDISNVTFENNATGSFGGAVAITGDPIINLDGNLNGGIKNAAFRNNTAGGDGGALDIEGDISGGITDSTFTGNAATGGSGGALFLKINLLGGISQSTFTDNEALSLGGAVAVLGNLTGGIRNSAFTNNASDGDGGAIFVANNLTGGIRASDFTDNTSATTGGAIFVGVDLTGGVKNSTFTDNTSDGTGGALYAGGNLKNGITNSAFINNSSTNDQGGAVYVEGDLTGGISGSTFTGNTAGSNGGAVRILNLTGGINNSTFTGNTASFGGAVFISENLDNISGSTFKNNIANGAGGALYAGHNLTVSDAEFTGNKAVGIAGDPASGQGGAIFVDAVNGPSLKLNALAGKSIIFSGNTMRPGSAGAIPNSIYFGNKWIGGAGGVITATFKVEQGGTLQLLDPLASQPDNLKDGFGNILDSVILKINKTGTGTMVLAGLNNMQSATDWTVSAGTLRLVADAKSKPAGIKLSNTTNAISAANPARFTLKSGASLLMEPTTTAHQISGKVINFESGSKVGIAGFRYGPVMDKGPHTVLTLNAANVSNQSSVPVTSGTISIGAMNYTYSKLGWDVLHRNLIMNFSKPTPDPARTGAPALTGTSAIGIYNPAFNTFNTRAVNAFRYLPGFESAGAGIVNPEDAKDADKVSLGDFGAGKVVAPAAGDAASRDLVNSLWMTPYFSFTDQSDGNSLTGYNLRTPGLAFGYERQLTDRAFAGIGASLSWPDYSGGGTDINAFDATFALYGGILLPLAIELDARIGYGFVSYDQTRHVQGQRYSSDYNGNTFFAGAGLGRTFSFARGFYLRPGVHYDYIHLSTNGYDEGDSLFALKIDDYDQNLHRLKAGLEAGYEAQNGLRLSAEAYYLGLYGNRRAQASAHFTADPANGFTALGDALDENNLGLGARANYSVNEQWELGAGYNAVIGKDTVNNEVNLDVTFRF